jgi:pyruvate/2-oxoglutarate dehydrogenase complex dihydrolipoamide acyltransferase (E2) component
MIRKTLVAVLLGCSLAACAAPPAPQQQAAPPPAPAAPASEAAPPPTPRVTSEAQIAPGRWDVDRVRCSDLLGASDDDRASAAMFYYGYLAAKAGIRVIDVRQIDGNIRKVMDQCAAAPNMTVPQAFRQALGRRR